MPEQALERLLSAAESARELGMEHRAHELFELARALRSEHRDSLPSLSAADPQWAETGVRPKITSSIEDTPSIFVEESADEILVTLEDTFSGGERQSHPAIPLVRPARHRGQLDEGLPGWMPGDRILGSFYVHRSLGSGAFSSVFVATRKEDVGISEAEQFALKLPDYDAMATQGLDEGAAEQLFREEAAALLTLPAHPNLARLVGFDQTSASKPFLVMELVTGPSCDVLLDAGEIDVERARNILEGVLEALAVMHAAGIGHLDLKPANVVLRTAASVALPNVDPSAGDVPVLVDFGLAGRRVRPGYATAEYAAPEVWHQDVSSRANPTIADMYSFGCLAFELLTGDMLFDGGDLQALRAMHNAHDGRPKAIRSLAESGHVELATMIESCLRHDPASRSTARELRPTLKKLPLTNLR